MNVWVYTTIPSAQEILVVRTGAAGARLPRRNAKGGWPIVPATFDTGDIAPDRMAFQASLNDVCAGPPLATPSARTGIVGRVAALPPKAPNSYWS